MDALAGRSVLVTGAARGQGRSHAVTLAEAGCDTILVDVCGQLSTVPYEMASPDDLAETKRLVEATGKRALALEADVRDFTALSGAVESGIDAFGKIDFLVANAGIWSYGGMTHEIPEDLWDEMLDVNLKGVWQTLRAVIPHMIERQFGRIVVTSSMVVRGGFGYIGHYNAAKFGASGLVKTVAIELADKGITCNAVLPTNCNTPMIRHELMYKLMSQGGYTVQASDVSEPTVESAIPGYSSIHALPIPWVEPEDVSAAVLYLLSDSGRYITGTELEVNGGYNRAI